MIEVYDSLFGFKVTCDFNNCLGLSDGKFKKFSFSIDQRVIDLINLIRQ